METIEVFWIAFRDWFLDFPDFLMTMNGKDEGIFWIDLFAIVISICFIYFLKRRKYEKKVVKKKKVSRLDANTEKAKKLAHAFMQFCSDNNISAILSFANEQDTITPGSCGSLRDLGYLSARIQAEIAKVIAGPADLFSAPLHHACRSVLQKKSKPKRNLP